MKQKLRSEIVGLIEKKQVFEEYVEGSGGRYHRCTYEELFKALIDYLDVKLVVDTVPEERTTTLRKKGK